jgi:hypothetical protein
LWSANDLKTACSAANRPSPKGTRMDPWFVASDGAFGTKGETRRARSHSYTKQHLKGKTCSTLSCTGALAPAFFFTISNIYHVTRLHFYRVAVTGLMIIHGTAFRDIKTIGQRLRNCLNVSVAWMSPLYNDQWSSGSLIYTRMNSIGYFDMIQDPLTRSTNNSCLNPDDQCDSKRMTSKTIWETWEVACAFF